MPLRFALLVSILVSACEPSNLFVVDVRTDWVPGQEVVRIYTAIDGAEVAMTPVAFGDDLAGGFRVAEVEGLTPGVHDVEVRLLGDMAPVASRRVRVRVERAGAVTVVVSRDCADVSCLGDVTGSTECVGGRCVAPECTPQTPEACPDTGCRSDAECSAPVSCASASCVTGACLSSPIAGACGDEAQCDPTSGCRPFGEVPLMADRVEAGFAHSCAADRWGVIHCWGSNLGGALRRPEFGSFAAVEVFHADLFGIVSGRHFSCLIEAGQMVYCWGDNEAGALGRDSSGEERGRLYSIDAPLGVVPTMYAGTSHVCARSFERLLCWGRNDFGQAAFASLEDPVRPVHVDLDAYVLALGERHSCAIAASSTEVLCWGANGSGELGDGTELDRRTPAPVVGTSGATQIAATSNLNGAANGATCAIVEGDEVWCWGYNQEGQLGNSTSTHSPVPLRVQGLARADSIVAGAKSFCARDGADTYCWGQNANGELGLGTTSSFETRAMRAPMLDRFSSLSLGHGFGCGTDGGRVYCWGDNRLGQLNGAEGEPEHSLTPIEVTLE